MSKIVSIKGLTKKIGRKQVLKGLDIELGTGRVVGLLGPNGAGKTTLLKILMNIYHADAGEVQICGERLGFETKRHISYMPDTNHLFQWMCIRDAIHYYRDMFSDFDENRSAELCAFLGINKEENIKNLSKGTVERVLIMLTFSRNTCLYLLDEPIGGIDPLARNKIIKTIFRGFDPGRTIIISTHQVKDVETLLDEVLFIDEGKLIFSDSVDNIRELQGKSIEECYMEVFENA
jgi:ABC-2 type transport system ATP-binding protein